MYIDSWHPTGRAAVTNTSLTTNDNKRYATTNSLKRGAHLRLMTDVLQNVLSMHTTPRPQYLLCPGSTPFFHGVEVVADSSLCEHLKQAFEPTDDDDDDYTKKQKKELRSCYRTFAGAHQSTDALLVQLYRDPKDAMMFLKKALKSCGLSLKGSPRKVTIDGKRLYVMMSSTPIEDLALMIDLHKAKYVVDLLPQLLYTGNLSDVDKAWVGDGVELYNVHAKRFGAEEILIRRPPRDRLINQVVIARRRVELTVENNQNTPGRRRKEGRMEEERREIAALFLAAEEQMRRSDEVVEASPPVRNPPLRMSLVRVPWTKTIPFWIGQRPTGDFKKVWGQKQFTEQG